MTRTNAELETVITVPEQYRKAGRRFCVIRYHNGVADILDNIGDDDDRVRFRTDCFSQYAIAYEAVNINRLLVRFAVTTALSLLLALICFAYLIHYRRKARRAAAAARRARMEEAYYDDTPEE